MSKKSTTIKLPKYWENIVIDLQPVEKIIYENYNDAKTKKSRNYIIKYHKLLKTLNSNYPQVNDFKESAWNLIRFSVLVNLFNSKVNYSASVKDGLISIISILYKFHSNKITQNSNSIYSQINEMVLKSSNDLTPQKLSKFIQKSMDKILEEIRCEQKIGIHGINRKRFKMIN